VKLFSMLFSKEAKPEQAEADSSAFEAAIAAIDRAAAERQQQSSGNDRRATDRRAGAPDQRPPGSPDRRSQVT
jgi:hypothetical protein